MDENERKLRIQAIVARKAQISQARERRAQDRSALQQLTQVKRTASVPTGAAKNISGLSVDRALSTADIPDIAQALNPQLAAPTPDQQDRIEEISASEGGRDPNGVGTEVSRDIEGNRAGSTERVSGDHRLVVDAQDHAIATREEYPRLDKHLGALVHGEKNDASVIGTLSNFLGALVRPVATLTNYTRGNSDNKNWANLPRDMLQASVNEKGNTVGEGGLVASRGSGFGDTMRANFRDAMAGRNNAKTIGDLFERSLPIPASGVIGNEMINQWLNVYPAVKKGALTASTGASRGVDRATAFLQGVDQKNLDLEPYDTRTTQQLEYELRAKFDPDRLLSSIKDINDPVFDSFGELTGLVHDPMNLVSAPEKLAAKVAAAAGKVPVVGKAASSVIDHLMVKDITKAFSKQSTLAGDLEKDFLKAGLPPDEARSEAALVARKRYEDEGRVRAESSMENNAQQKLLEKAAASQRAKDAPLVRALIEGGDHNVPIMVDKSDLQQVQDIQHAAQGIAYDGLDSEEAAFIKGWTPGSKPSDDLMFNRTRLSEKLGLDQVEDHPWLKGNVDQVGSLVAAKHIRRALRRNLERDQLAGLLRKDLRVQGYMPHAPRSEISSWMEKVGVPRAVARPIENLAAPFTKTVGYDPRKAREMAALGDLEVLRRAATVAVDADESKGLVPPSFLVRFARDKKLADPGAGHWPKIGNQSDPQAAIAVRQELERRNVFVNEPAGDVVEANRMLENKGAHGTGVNVDVPIRFHQDGIQAAAAYRNAMAPRQMQAEIGQSVLSLVDSQQMPIVRHLEMAILKPKNGIRDQMLVHKMRTDPLGGRAALFQNGTLIHDASSFLSKRGLVYIRQGEDLAMAMPALSGKVIPRAIYKDLLKVAPRMNSGVLEKAARIMAQMTNLWVPTVLNTPGFHIRNAFFGQFQVFLAIGHKIANPKMWRAAGVVAAAAENGGLAPGLILLNSTQHKIADLVAEVRRLGVHEGGRVADMESALNRGLMPYKDEHGQDLVRRLNPLNASRGLFTKEPLAKALVSHGIGRALGLGGAGSASSENVQRIMIYLTKRAGGEPPKSAARTVVKFMFDYTGAQLHPIEKTLRRFMPFYQWVKQSTLLTVDQMLKQPGKYAAVNHLYETMDAFTRSGNQDPRHTPDYLHEAGAIGTPFMDDKPGSRSMMQMERPGTQASQLLAPLLGGDVKGTAKAIASQMNPIVTMGIERMTGKDVFGDRELSPTYDEQMATPWEKVWGQNAEDIPGYAARKLVGGYPGLGMEGVLGLVNPELVSKNPRFTGRDETERQRNRLISMLLGVRPSQTDAEGLASHAAKNIAEKRKKLHARRVEAAKRRLQNRR